MNSETSKILSKILNRREIDKIPTDTVKKIEKYFDERFEEFISSQAVHESSQRSISEYRIFFRCILRMHSHNTCVPLCVC